MTVGTSMIKRCAEERLFNQPHPLNTARAKHSHYSTHRSAPSMTGSMVCIMIVGTGVVYDELVRANRDCWHVVVWNVGTM